MELYITSFIDFACRSAGNTAQRMQDLDGINDGAEERKRQEEQPAKERYNNYAQLARLIKERSRVQAAESASKATKKPCLKWGKTCEEDEDCCYGMNCDKIATGTICNHW